MSEKEYLIKNGWSYTGAAPHSWRDPESLWPYNVGESYYSLEDAMQIQTNRDGVERSRVDKTATTTIDAQTVIHLIDRIDNELAEAGSAPLSEERMIVERIRRELRHLVELSDPTRRSAGLLGTRKSEYKPANSE